MNYLLKTFTVLYSLLMSGTTSAQWESLHGPYGGYISDLAQNDQFQFAATDDGLFRSQDGKNWSLLQIIPGKRTSSWALDVNDSTIIVSATEYDSPNFLLHCYLSKSNGDHWVEISLPASTIFGLYLTGFGIYAYDYYNLWFSSNEGQSWNLSSFPLDTASIYVVTTDHQHMFVGSSGKIYISEPDSDLWNFISIPAANAQVHHLYVEDSLILAIAPYSGLLLKSTDLGQTWKINESERWSNNTYENFGKIKDIYFLSLDSLILKSYDQGLTWINCTSKYYVTAKEMLAVDTSLLFASFVQGVFRSDDAGESCYSATEGISAASVKRLALKDNVLLTACNTHGVFEYSITDQLWGKQYDDTLWTEDFYDLESVENSFYISDGSNHIFRFSDELQKWIDISDFNQKPNYSQLYPYGNKLVASNDGLKVWNPASETWDAIDITFNGDTILSSLFAYSEDYIFTATPYDVLRRISMSANWERILSIDSIEGLHSQSIKGIYTAGQRLFLITHQAFGDFHYHHILSSEDNGTTWHFAEDNFPTLDYEWWTGIDQINDINGYAFANAYSQNLGIAVAPPGSHQWYTFNEGLPDLFVNDIVSDDQYIYAATSRNGVWRRKITDLEIVSTHPLKDSNSLQIYPNPASEFIHFNLPGDLTSTIQVSLNDLYGRLLKIEKLPAENNLMNVANIPAGLYIMVIESNGHQFVQKLMIVH